MQGGSTPLPWVDARSANIDTSRQGLLACDDRRLPERPYCSCRRAARAEHAGSSRMEQVGILGLPQSGKTTLFEILVQAAGAHSAATAGRERVAVIVVPDERVDRLAALYKPKKVTHARV